MNSSLLSSLITLLLLLGSISVKAQTTNAWTGGTDTDWHTTTNWSLTLVPTATHNVVIPGSLTNYPILSSAASASTVEVRSGASLTISSVGSLSVNGSKILVLGGFSYSMGFYNGGTVVNSGSLSVGTSAAMGQTALWNASSFTNMATGNITLDNSSLFNESGSSFVNSGSIRVGTSAAVGLSALWNASSFTNTATGNITLDRSSVSGLFNSGSFVNSGSVTAGSSAAVGAYALRNSSSFTNTATGNITLNNSRTSGLLNSSGGSFVNSATITIGTSLTGNAIQNDGTFTNQGGGCINPAPGLINSLGDGVITNNSSFSNTGTIIENSTGNSGISFNGGVIQNLNGGSFTVAFSGGFSVAYVTQTGAGLRNGSSWTDAFSGTALQTAIDAVAGCGEVWVAAGLYKPTTGTSRTVSFAMKNGVAIYGGFAGGEGSLADRPTSTLTTPSGTTLSGDIGTAGNTDNSYHVFFNPPGLTTTAILDGFVITGGNANGFSFPAYLGGGMYNNGVGSGQVCSPTIRNCTFQGNSAELGGAMYNNGTYGSSSPVLTNCAFQGNSASVNGGAMYNNGATSGLSRPLLTNCVLFGNGGNNTFFNFNATGASATYSLFDNTTNVDVSDPTNLTVTVSPFASPTSVALAACSPAINMGLNSANSTTVDLAGNPRVVEGRIDMGAVEYQAPLYPTRLYVAASQTALTGDGLSWATAFPNLQSALTYPCSQSVTEIWVARGVYKPGTNRGDSFAMRNGVAIYGGFVGSETLLTGRPAINLTTPSGTTLSGDIGTVGSNTDNSYHVIYNPASLSLNNTAVLDGFVITDGNANGSSFPNIAGGGMFNDGEGAGEVCSPLIRNCAFQNNSAVFFGGAMYNDGRTGGTSSPSLINCLFQNNTAGSNGGAIQNNGNTSGGTSSPILTNCAFQSNTAGSNGGAMYNTGNGGTSNPILTNCFFQSNTAANGGAMANNSTSSPRLTNCAFQNNAATVDGGAINNNGSGGNSSPILTNCSFQSNTAGRDGGAMFHTASGGPSSPVITNCVVWGNGGNKTFVNDIATGISASYSLFENTVANYTATNSLTISVSPFASTTGVALNACSPAINAGNPASTSATGAPAAIGTTDLVGNPRFFSNARIDMGAVEFQGAGPAQTTLTAAPSTTLTCAQTSLTLTATSGASYTFAGPGLNQSGAMSTAVVSQSGVYSVTATDATGCTSMTSITITAGNTTTTTTFTVTSTDDSGPNTLRQAMLDVMATTCPGPFTIIVTASGLISLTSVLPTISKDITFIGPGATNLTVRRSSASNFRLFTIPSTNTVRFDGFTLADGYATTGSLPANQGGAIYHGGGSSLTVTNCVFNTNRASVDGGAIFSEGTQLVLSNCAFTGNTASGYGGALESYSPNPVITNCTFTNNTASVGGAVDFYNSSPNITNCAFVGNSAGEGRAGAIATLGGSATVNSSSFRQNTGGSGQAQTIYNASSSFSLNNCVLFGNGIGQPITNGGSSTVVARYSLFEPSVTGYTNGGNNLTTTLSPFASATGVALNAYAPAINAGDPASTTVANPPYSATDLPALDLTGNTRIVAGRVDMGAVEYAGPGSFTTTLTAGPSSTLTCTQTSLTLTATGAAGVPGTSYTFTGPGLSQSGSMSTAVASQSGTYSVTATDATGCTSVASTTVVSNTAAPTASLASSNSLNCSVSSATLTATATPATAGLTYTFTGGALPGSPSANSTVTVNQGGSYSVLVTAANGCTALQSTSVASSTALPTVSVSATSGTLTCALTSITLTATSSGTGLLWSNAATTQSITVNSAGTYSVTATGINGCSAVSNSVVISSSMAAPTGANLTASNSGTLTCAVQTLTLTATATGSSLSYAFAGPSGAMAGSGNTRTTSAAGLYSVTITGGNGCTTTASTTVFSNTLTPTAGLVASGTITCAVPAVTLTASGGGNYTFGGSGIVSTAGNLATVNLGGTYSVTVLNPANGCFATNTVSVSSDIGGASAAPMLSASSSVVCAGANVMVVATVSGSPTGLQWYRDGQVVSGQTSATLSLGGVQAAQAGSYALVITGACSVTSTPFMLMVNPLPTVTILVPQGSMVNGPGTGTATITLPAPLTGVAMQVLGGTSFERLIVIDRVNGFEIRQVDSNANGIFNVNRTGPFSLTVADANGCKRTVEGTVVTR